MQERELEIRSFDLWTMLKIGVLMGLISGILIALVAYAGIGVGVRMVWHTEIPGVYRHSFERPVMLFAAVWVLAYALLIGLWVLAAAAIYNISAAIVGGAVVRVRERGRDVLDDCPGARHEELGQEPGRGGERTGDVDTAGTEI